AARARRHRARRGADARRFGRPRPRPCLRLGHLQRSLLRPLARRPPALVLDARVRQRGEGAPPPGARPERRVRSRYRWVILGVGAAGAGAFSALRMGLPALGPALRDAYGLTLPQVGFAFTAVAIGVMLTLVPWGVLTDRIGERPVMGVGLAGCSAALVATA